MTLDYIQEFGDGWLDLVNSTLEKIEAIDPHFRVLQIKEKWGKLRLYGESSYEYGTPNSMLIESIIDEAEEHSGTVCEFCGLPGKLYTSHGETRTVCKKHTPDD